MSCLNYILPALYLTFNLNNIEGGDFSELCEFNHPRRVNLNSYMQIQTSVSNLSLNAKVLKVDEIVVWEVNQHTIENESTGFYNFYLNSRSYHDVMVLLDQMETELYIDFNMTSVRPYFVCNSPTYSWTAYSANHLSYNIGECLYVVDIPIISPRKLRKIRISQHANDYPKLLQFYDDYIVQDTLYINISRLFKVMYTYQGAEQYPLPNLNINLHTCYRNNRMLDNDTGTNGWPDRTKYHRKEVYERFTQLCTSIRQPGIYNIIHKHIDSNNVIYSKYLRLRRGINNTIIAVFEGDFTSVNGLFQSYKVFKQNFTVLTNGLGTQFIISSFSEFNVSMTEYSGIRHCQFTFFRLNDGSVETMSMFPYEKFHLRQTLDCLYVTVYSHTYPTIDFVYPGYYFESANCELRDVSESGIIMITPKPKLVVIKILRTC